MTSSPFIAPSVLPADFSHLGAELESLAEAGVDRIHWDVMDGNFVPNLTIGPDVVRSCRPVVDLAFEAHLMVTDADLLAPEYISAGCSLVMVHVEACVHLHRTLARIRDLGASAGVVLNPHSPIDQVGHVLDLIDQVLVMTVNPGFGGQSYLSSMEPKVAATRALLDTADHWIDLEVDGGISAATIAGAAAAGANGFVSGSALFGHPEGRRVATDELRALANSARG